MIQPLLRYWDGGSSYTFVRIPGTMCDDRLWHKLHWPEYWTTRDVSLSDCGNLEAMAAELLLALQGPLVPVGFSMGGMVALEMARQAPDRIAGLVLIGTNHLADHPCKRQARHRNLDRLAEVGLATVVSEELIPRYFACRPDDADCQIIIEMAQAAGPIVLHRQYEALASRRDQAATIRQSQSPILVISGEHDLMCEPGQQRAMAGLAADANMHILPGAAHMVPLEVPHELMKVMTQWVEARIEGELCQIAS